MHIPLTQLLTLNTAAPGPCSLCPCNKCLVLLVYDVKHRRVSLELQVEHKLPWVSSMLAINIPVLITSPTGQGLPVCRSRAKQCVQPASKRQLDQEGEGPQCELP